MKTFNFIFFQEMIDIVPMGLCRSQKKEQIPKKMREEIAIRDNSTCQCCGLEDTYGSAYYEVDGKLNMHHIIPNGKAHPSNITTLCKYCHNAVHLILFISGKWRYIHMR